MVAVPMSPMSQYAPQTYDAVWAMALALKGAEERWRDTRGPLPSSGGWNVKLDRFDYTRHDMAAEFLRQFSQLNFMGISVSKREVGGESSAFSPWILSLLPLNRAPSPLKAPTGWELLCSNRSRAVSCNRSPCSTLRRNTWTLTAASVWTSSGRVARCRLRSGSSSSGTRP